MDLLQTVRKEGSRGGVDFKWEDVKNSQHRQNYLGHSVMAPVGRWQKNRDLNWYAKADDADKTPEEVAAAEKERRKEELRKVKEAEEDAMARALGLPVPDRSANTEPLGERKIDQKEVDAALKVALEDIDAPEKIREKSHRSREQRRRSRSRDRHGRDRDRRRSRSRHERRSSRDRYRERQRSRSPYQRKRSIERSPRRQSRDRSPRRRSPDRSPRRRNADRSPRRRSRERSRPRHRSQDRTHRQRSRERSRDRQRHSRRYDDR